MSNKKNLWLLFEERPKPDVIKSIFSFYCKDNNKKFNDKGLKIKPCIENNKFTNSYLIENFEIENIFKIELLLVSGTTSFVDFLLFETDKKPMENKNLDGCVYGIEETKTDSKESRNTAAGQRGTKFLFLEYFSKISSNETKGIMLYNNQKTQLEKEASSVEFMKKCLKTCGITFLGDYSKNYSSFEKIEDLINFKNKLRAPPKGNTPVRLTQFQNEIRISGTLSKPKDKGNIGHDPNQGQHIGIINALRKLGWEKAITVTDHKVSQEYVNNNKKNKYLFAMKILNFNLQNINSPQVSIPKNYWMYENNGEKVATILLHLIMNYLNIKSIYENHAGSERGYFYSSSDEEFAVEKKYKGKNINLPDYVFIDDDEKIIFVCEGEMFKNYKKGIEQIKTFNLFNNNYIKKYYSNYKIKNTIILSDGDGKKLQTNVLFQLNSDGTINWSNELPEKVKNFLNDCSN